MSSVLSAKFHLPPQDLEAPTAFPANCNAVTTWLATLPKANLGQWTRAIYGAVTELNRVRMTPALRLQILELLRPAIHTATQGLRRHYLNQPIELPQQAQQVAQLAHVLHEQLATGYVLIAVHAQSDARQSGFSNIPHAIATAAHRGISEHSLNLLRDYQLYRTPHPGCWATLHQLAKLAREQNVFDVSVADTQLGNSTIESAYSRALLLGGSHPNQLRQDHLSRLFQHALQWTDAVRLTAPDQALLVADPESDEGPSYREFATPTAQWVGIDTAQLAPALEAQSEVAETQSLTDQALPPDLLRHLAQTWSNTPRRSHMRIDVRESIEIALGLTAAHHFIGGEIDFSLLLHPRGHSSLALQDENIFLRPKPAPTEQRSNDVWNSPYEPKLGVMSVSLEILDSQISEQNQKALAEREREKFSLQSVERVNVSPGGLCITWPPNSHVQLRSGEAVGIREKGQKNWSIGVVRWVQLTEVGPRLGIELLSPNAAPYGARVIIKTGDNGEYLRVLVLPEIKQINQPTTLLAPRLPFRVGQKVSLMRHDKETRIQLTRKIASTAAFNQFEFKRLTAAKPDEPEPKPKTATRDGSFDILWDSL